MDARQCAFKIAAYYRQSTVDKVTSRDGKTSDIPNLVFVESFRWIELNINDYEMFYNKVLASFKPSMTVPHPVISDFEDVLRMMPKQTALALPAPVLPESEPVEIDDGDEGKVRASIEQILEDDKKLRPDEMLKQYGKTQCIAAWSQLDIPVGGRVREGAAENVDVLCAQRKSLLSESKEWSVDRIFNRIETAYRKSYMNSSDIDFISWWDKIYYHWTRLRAEGKPVNAIVSYCEQVKLGIINEIYNREHAADVSRAVNQKRDGKMKSFNDVVAEAL